MNDDIGRMAHLLRRAGFGATRAELDEYLEKGYEAAVEELLDPADTQSMPEDLIRRYHVDQAEARLIDSVGATWMYRLVTTSAPLEEKMVLFWHGLFATSDTKVFQEKSMLSQLDMFRRLGLGDFRTLLVELSRDPAMIFWLDNQDNHRQAINENYGRELLELFSMGVGNYTEDDIKECARAFTGWTIENAEYMALRSNSASIWPYSKIAWQFHYDEDDHDDGEKTFLGETGRFNGEDIVDIIVKTARDGPVRRPASLSVLRLAGRRRGWRATDWRPGTVLLRLRIRDTLDAADAVQLRSLQVRGGPFRADKEPRGADRRHAEAGPLPPVAYTRGPRRDARVGLHGPAALRPAVRGGLARG